jgi:hypothetical protein
MVNRKRKSKRNLWPVRVDLAWDLDSSIIEAFVGVAGERINGEIENANSHSQNI